MEAFSKALSQFVALVLALGLMPLPAFAQDITAAKATGFSVQAASDHSADDAINWAKSKVGTPVGYDDGSGYFQCVEFIQAYYQYLGVSAVSGNGCDYASNALPAGWTRTAGGQPQKGDILVYGVYGSQAYGHVAIYESDSSLYDQDGSVWGATVKHETANYRSYTWAYWGCIHPNFGSGDRNGPSHSDYRVAEIESAKFTVMAKVTDPSGVRSVSYAVWTENNGQDDLKWYDGHCTDGNDYYWAHIPYSDHKNEKGNYIVHMYAYDNAGNQSVVPLSYRFDAGNPKVEDFHAWELKDTRFTVSAKITSPNGIGTVRYAVWTEYGGQDDLVWYDAVYETTGKFYYIYVPFGEHNNERGNYIVHLYAYDKGGKLTTSGISYVASRAVPSTSVTEGTYAIRSKLDTSMGLDVAAHSQDDQANVWLYKWNGAETGPHCQKFAVKLAGDGSYYLIANHSNKAVEVYGASGASSANVSQFTQNQSAAQRWYFVKNADGTYTLRNKATGHVMDVAGGKTANGTNVQQYPAHGGDNQRFYLVPTDASMWSISVPDQQYSGASLEPAPSVTAGGVALAEGVDFTVSYANNVNAGTATVTVSGKGAYTGSKKATFKINATQQAEPVTSDKSSKTSSPSKGGQQQTGHKAAQPISISAATVTGVKSMTYTGKALVQSPIVKVGGKTLRAGIDYMAIYTNNVKAGTATIRMIGKGSYTGAKQVTFTIVKANVKSAKAVKVKAQKYKNGKAIRPKPKLTYMGKTLKKGVDFTLKYKNNKKRGTAKIIVKGKGNFKGTKTVKFKIK